MYEPVCKVPRDMCNIWKKRHKDMEGKELTPPSQFAFIKCWDVDIRL